MCVNTPSHLWMEVKKKNFFVQRDNESLLRAALLFLTLVRCIVSEFEDQQEVAQEGEY